MRVYTYMEMVTAPISFDFSPEPSTQQSGGGGHGEQGMDALQVICSLLAIHYEGGDGHPFLQARSSSWIYSMMM